MQDVEESVTEEVKKEIEEEMVKQIRTVEQIEEAADDVVNNDRLDNLPHDTATGIVLGAKAMLVRLGIEDPADGV